MGALLDTHALIWWVTADQRISSKLRRHLGRPDVAVHVSAATAWEITTKVRIGKLDVPASLLQDFVEVVEQLGFTPLPITLGHGQEAGRLPGTHRDPFDRVLAAQAKLEKLDLVTRDPAFEAMGVKTMW